MQLTKINNHTYLKLRNMPKSRFFTFLQDLKGYELRYKGKEVPFWQAFNVCKSATKIKEGKTKITAIVNNSKKY